MRRYPALLVDRSHLDLHHSKAPGIVECDVSSLDSFFAVHGQPSIGHTLVGFHRPAKQAILDRVTHIDLGANNPRAGRCYIVGVEDLYGSDLPRRH